MSAQRKADRKRLGRGLSSLITGPQQHDEAGDEEYKHVTGLPPLESSSKETSSSKERDAVTQIATDRIAPNPYQPRAEFSESALAELSQSISQQGMLQPLVVAPAPAGSEKEYLIIAGERRLRAARQIDMSTVPCIVRRASRRQMLEWALIENIQRADLNPIERAMAYRQYIDRFNLTQSDAAERLGQPRTTVANHLRLLDMHESVRDMLTSGELTLGHGKVLATLNDNHEKQLNLARKAAKGGLNVRQLEQLISGDEDGKRKQSRSGKTQKPPYIKDVETRLSNSIGAKVSIHQSRGKNKGKIVIRYSCLEDFDRIADALGLESEVQTS